MADYAALLEGTPPTRPQHVAPKSRPAPSTAPAPAASKGLTLEFKFMYCIHPVRFRKWHLTHPYASSQVSFTLPSTFKLPSAGILQRCDLEESGTSSNDAASGEVEEKGGKAEKDGKGGKEKKETNVKKRPSTNVEKPKRKAKDEDADLTALGTCKGNDDDENDEPPVEDDGPSKKKKKKSKAESSKGERKKNSDKKRPSKSEKKGKKKETVMGKMMLVMGKMMLVTLKVNRLKKSRKFLR